MSACPYGSFMADFLPSETIHGVIIDHADRLHVGVADGTADDAEAALFEVATYGVPYRRAGGNFLYASPGVPDRPAVHGAPLVGIEEGELHNPHCKLVSSEKMSFVYRVPGQDLMVAANFWLTGRVSTNR